MKLSVIIVSYNVRCYLQQCLDSLQRALDGVDAEICVIDNLSGVHTPRKIGPMLKFADIVVVTKGDIVSQAEREVFMFNIRQVNNNAKIVFINGITGQGAFMLGKHAESAAEIPSLRGYKLRFTTPSSVCSYCTGETRIDCCRFFHQLQSAKSQK